jgi:hypothetical protein
VVDAAALNCHLRSLDITVENAFVCTYLIMNLLEHDPALSLFDVLLQAFGHCIREIHRCEEIKTNFKIFVKDYRYWYPYQYCGSVQIFFMDYDKS